VTTAFLYHQDCLEHNMGSQHPESPQRIYAIERKLKHSNLMDELIKIEPEAASKKHLLRVHPDRYINQLYQMTPKAGLVYADPDTAISPNTLHAATLAAGSAVIATDTIMKGQAKNAFCAVRPPGHHAEYNKTMGFCFFNNIAVGVMHALQEYGLERVAIIDFDVHHGNGTVDIFKDDPRVMICSSFQYPFYPDRYQHFEADHIINTPLDAHTKSIQFRNAIERDWQHKLEQHKPEMIFISAGFDAHKDDPLGELELTDSDFRWITQFTKNIADNYAKGRIMSILEGGYNLEALATSAQAHIAVLAGY